MIKIETLETAGFKPALMSMRNPYDSWAKSDTGVGEKEYALQTGPADKELSLKLQHGGPEHCKHLRMITVWADITAPLYWWKEADTYRAGVEKVSCSTMHTITKTPFHPDMFSGNVDRGMINWLELQRGFYLAAETEERKRTYWRNIIENLPSGFLQKRTVMFSYAALRNIYRQRAGHKLTEWQQFREWCEQLPESWMITE